MISLCSGCAHYYNFYCDKLYDEKALVRKCDHFRFQATKHFKKPEQLASALLALEVGKFITGPTTTY
jgi:hypothetical protein